MAYTVMPSYDDITPEYFCAVLSHVTFCVRLYYVMTLCTYPIVNSYFGSVFVPLVYHHISEFFLTSTGMSVSDSLVQL